MCKGNIDKITPWSALGAGYTTTLIDHLPSQVVPFAFSTNPSSQVQLKEPAVFTQWCSQGFCSHSLISAMINRNQNMNV